MLTEEQIINLRQWPRDAWSLEAGLLIISFNKGFFYIYDISGYFLCATQDPNVLQELIKLEASAPHCGLVMDLIYGEHLQHSVKMMALGGFVELPAKKIKERASRDVAAMLKELGL